MESLKKSLGETIYRLRTSRKPKMSREKLAEKVGVDPTTIYRWETGRAYPEGANIEAIARALGCKVGDLYSQPNPTTISDLNNPDRILEILERLESRLPDEKAQAEIARLQGQVEGYRDLLQEAKDLIGPHRQILKALNDRPEMVPGVQAFLGIDRESGEGTENGDRSNRSS